MTNLNKLLKQAQKMQEKVQQEMEALVVEETAGGGMVAVRMSGQKILIKVTLIQASWRPPRKRCWRTSW